MSDGLLALQYTEMNDGSLGHAESVSMHARARAHKHGSSASERQSLKLCLDPPTGLDVERLRVSPLALLTARRAMFHLGRSGRDEPGSCSGATSLAAVLRVTPGGTAN
jgi:hypothetical protein